MRECHQLDTHVEILEIVVAGGADVEEMRARAVHHERAVLHAEGAGLVAGFPIVEVLAVEKLDEAVGVGGAQRRREQEEAGQRNGFHKWPATLSQPAAADKGETRAVAARRRAGHARLLRTEGACLGGRLALRFRLRFRAALARQ